jgi:hypothetical protein
MRALLPVVVAGGTFAAAAVIGLFGGILAAERIGKPLLVPIGLGAGAAIGGLAALRVIVRAVR